MTMPPHPMSLLEAIAREEGFYLAGSRSQRNNNPGNLEWGKFSQAHGATHGDPRFAVFPDAETGFAAMRVLFQCPGYRGLTVEAALNRWAPPVENQTSAYLKNVCTWTGLAPGAGIDGVLDRTPDGVAAAPPALEVAKEQAPSAAGTATVQG